MIQTFSAQEMEFTPCHPSQHSSKFYVCHLKMVSIFDVGNCKSFWNDTKRLQYEKMLCNKSNFINNFLKAYNCLSRLPFYTLDKNNYKHTS